ncbi:hypothetical protein NTE_02512 [Candidatus Nitrososphaera evergladensis SR1]|jgi:hypothetical protein|uniref:Uncharacterized protein n=1 Tax=Candidatus Nitrososphaera evergladensis SR1 TaxID=1459636 RepID=A0A075MSK7_9ARCH|nr:hypothetical protein [Candidatus Nitrososphaera evergladensis]AIF84561.1 hypothetical protein NTE_02512 [Candidatus Nitrososphaera evergladensis SR1]
MATTTTAKQAAILGLSAILVTGVAFSALLYGNVAQAQSDNMNMSDRITAAMKDNKRMVATGVLSTMQTGADGAHWLVYGPWRMMVVAQPNGEEGQNPNVTFNASVRMVMTDGNAMHRHTISDFKMSKWSSDDSSITIDGTAMITTRDGPAQVPVTVKILQKQVIVITLDTSVLNHFGETPLYGLVSMVRMLGQ